MWWKNEWDMQLFGLYKLTETWAHSLDVYESMNKDYEDTVRIEHVALYGWLNAEHATKLNKSKSCPALTPSPMLCACIAALE